MNLWKHPEYGTYYARFPRCRRFPNGKLKTLKTKDLKKAKELFRVMERKWHESRVAELDQGRRITLIDFKTDYIEKTGRTDLSADTLRMDELALRSLGDVIGHKRAVRAINDRDLIKFKDACLSRGLSGHSVRTYLRHIKAALNTAVTLGYAERLPQIPKVKTPKRKPKVVPADHMDKILVYALEKHLEMWRYITFALYTGCRRQECLNLTWQNVTIYDEPRGAVHGRARIVGKGDKERNIPLLKEAVEAMGDSKDIGPVFARHHKDYLSRETHKIVVACKLDSHRYSFHSLRHTSATRMVEKGIKLEIIQKILGHSDIRTTQIYAEIYDQVVEDEMGKMV